jgi:hypothetical protein
MLPAWVDAMCVKHPLATFEQKLALIVARTQQPADKSLRSDPFDAASQTCIRSTAGGMRVLVMMLRR